MKKLKTRNILVAIVLVFMVFQIFRGVSSLIGSLSRKGNIIVIDPGHGGKDPGTIGINNSLEKDINLDISKKLYKKLKGKGYEVIITRDKDEYIDNIQRAKLANKEKAKIFVSIHCNSAKNNSSANGIQVLYYPSNKATNNELFAQTVLDEVLRNTGANNKGIVERKDLIVLNQTNMPAIVVECGFLSNEDEANLLGTHRYQRKIVNGIVKGLENYIDGF